MSEEIHDPPIVEELVEEVVEDVLEDQPEEKMNSTLIYIAIVLLLCAAAYYFRSKRGKKKRKSYDIDETMATNTVSLKDISYIASKLNPDSTHLDVLMAVASCPDSIAYGLRAHNATQQLREDRILADKNEEKKNKKLATKPSDNMFNLDDDGWADDDDEEMDEDSKEKAKLAKMADEQKKKEQEQLNKATGKVKILLEGIDDGVIGQKWVENTLAGQGAWPPKDLRFLKDTKFDYNGKMVSAVDHPGLRRNLCMMMGRINSMMLNTHSELLKAGSVGLIDQTYFKGSMDFRQRCAMLLEAALRTAVACRNHALSKTVVETVGLFKIGCPPPGDVDWFNKLMMKQYQCLPRLKVDSISVECQGENEMATDDVLTLALDITRLHAEAFTKAKVALCQKQGIPPQLALQSYREGWWFLVKAECLDGDVPASTVDLKLDGLLKEVEKDEIEKFQRTPFNERLLTAWPMILQNITQTTGKVRIQVAAPAKAGKYRFTVSIHSQDFLGADNEFSTEGTIVDASTVVRKPKVVKEEDEESEESKKEK